MNKPPCRSQQVTHLTTVEWHLPRLLNTAQNAIKLNSCRFHAHAIVNGKNATFLIVKFNWPRIFDAKITLEKSHKFSRWWSDKTDNVGFSLKNELFIDSANIA